MHIHEVSPLYRSWTWNHGIYTVHLAKWLDFIDWESWCRSFYSRFLLVARGWGSIPIKHREHRPLSSGLKNETIQSMYKSHLPLVNAVTHALQKRWPQVITCIGSFRTFLQIGQVRVSSSLGFRGPVLLYTVVLLISYPCVLALVAILQLSFSPSLTWTNFAKDLKRRGGVCSHWKCLCSFCGFCPHCEWQCWQ